MIGCTAEDKELLTELVNCYSLYSRQPYRRMLEIVSELKKKEIKVLELDKFSTIITGQETYKEKF